MSRSTLLAAGLIGLAASRALAVDRPDGARPEMVLQLGHRDQVSALAFSPNGQLLATAGDKSLRLWDPRAGLLRRSLAGHRHSILGLAFSPDGRTLATGSADETARLWDVRTGLERVSLRHEDNVDAVAFSRDGQWLATASGGRLRLWNARTGAPRWTLTPHRATRHVFLGFSRDGSLVSVSDQQILVLDGKTGVRKRTLRENSAQMQGAALSPDGRRLAAGGLDATTQVWDVASGVRLLELKGRERWSNSWVASVAFSPDGRMLCTGGGAYDYVTRFWDLPSGRLRSTLPPRAEEEVRALAFSPNGKLLAAGSGDALLWRVPSGSEPRVLRRYTNDITAARFLPGGKRIAVAASDGVGLWDLQEGSLKWRSAGDALLGVSPDGGSLAVLGRTEVRWQRTETGAIQRRLPVGNGPLAVSPNGELLVTGSLELKLCDARTGSVLRELRGHSRSVTYAAFSPDGRYLATISDAVLISGEPSEFFLWDVRTGARLAQLAGFEWHAGQALFSPDGRLVAAGGMDRKVRLWTVPGGKLLHTLQGHEDMIESLAFSPDGRTLLTAASDNTARLWDVAAGRAVGVLRGHSEDVLSGAFSPDGSRILTSGRDHTVRIWETASRRLLLTLTLLPSARPERPSTEWIAATPTGDYDGSPGAERFIRWRSGDRLLPAGALRARFRRPERVWRSVR